MKKKITKIILTVLAVLLITSCESVPPETVNLSKAIGSDLQILRNSHCNLVEMYYGKIKTNVNTFIDDVYAPYVIHHVLQAEINKYRNGRSSLFGTIAAAGKTGGKSETEEALNVMMEFQEAANNQIAAKRNELLQPIVMQEKELMEAIERSYQNAIQANTTLVLYLTSLQKVKESQKEALSTVGLEGLDTTISNRLIEVSSLVDGALNVGTQIDVKSAGAFQKIEDVTNKIKSLTNSIKK